MPASYLTMYSDEYPPLTTEAELINVIYYCLSEALKLLIFRCVVYM